MGIVKYFKNKWMAFVDLFKDENDIDEKNVIGFASFVIMVLFAIVDIVAGVLGLDFTINRFIYDSFLFLTIACFGITELGGAIKSFNKKDKTKDFKDLNDEASKFT